jgi:hypothetical protein
MNLMHNQTYCKYRLKSKIKGHWWDTMGLALPMENVSDVLVLSCIVAGVGKYTCIYLGIKCFCILPLVIMVYKLVKHLKFNNIIFTKFLMNSYFMQVQYT